MARNENKVKCDMISIPANSEMNDRDYLNDVLEMEKNYSVNMTTFLNETSNETLFNSVDKLFKKIKQSQRDLFNLAWSKGFYTLETAEKTKITTKKNELNKKLKELT